MFAKQRFMFADILKVRDWQNENLEAFKRALKGRMNAEEFSRFVWTIYAVPGGGKTIAAALLAMWMFNEGIIDQVVFVVPNVRVLKQVAKAWRTLFGIHLMPIGHKDKQEDRRHTTRSLQDGLPPKFPGYIMTYQTMGRNPGIHAQAISYRKTLVIFDEVHHLGEDPQRDPNQKPRMWGAKAEEAFGEAPFVVSMTGTPYASDGVPIKFAPYVRSEDGRSLIFRADPEDGTGFTYSLGRAIQEGVCRRPGFIWLTGDVRGEIDGRELTISLRRRGETMDVVVSWKDGDTRTYGIDEDDPRGQMPDRLWSRFLEWSTTWPSVTRTNAFKHYLPGIRNEGRKVVVFLGGNTKSEVRSVMDAEEHLPDDLAEMGIDRNHILPVTSRGINIQEKLDNFDAGPAWIIPSVAMMSEGADHPTISVVFLMTTVTSPQTTIQRIGRAIRTIGEPGDDPWKIALVFAFPSPDMVRLARDIEKEITIAEKLYPARTKKPGDGSEPNPNVGVAIGGGDDGILQMGEYAWSTEKIEVLQKEFVAKGNPGTWWDSVMKLIVEEMVHGGASANGKR